MAGGEDIPLAHQWRGLNRLNAPHTLPEGESPNSVDTDFYQDTVGLLGPRRGRKRVFDATYPLLGCIPFDVPWATQRLVFTNNGSGGPTDGGATVADVPDAEVVPVAALRGWDKFSYVGDALYSAQTGIGDNYGVEVALVTPIDLSAYGRFAITGKDTDANVAELSFYGVSDFEFLDGKGVLQGKIDTVWTDLAQVTVDTAVIYFKQLLFSGSGTLTALRSWSHLDADLSALNITWRPTIVGVYGTEQAVWEEGAV